MCGRVAQVALIFWQPEPQKPRCVQGFFCFAVYWTISVNDGILADESSTTNMCIYIYMYNTSFYLSLDTHLSIFKYVYIYIYLYVYFSIYSNMLILNEHK